MIMSNLTVQNLPLYIQLSIFHLRASPLSSMLPFCCFFLLFSSTASAAAAAAAPKPKAFLGRVSFDTTSSQYLVKLYGADPHSYVLDLSNSVLWEACDSITNLSPVFCNSAICHSAIICNSAICSRAPPCLTQCLQPVSPTCLNNSCSVFITNTATKTSTSGQLWTRTLRVDSTNGVNPGPVVAVKGVAVGCGDESLLEVNHVIPPGVVGVAGLSRANIALPLQLASKASLEHKFAYCLPSGGSRDATGVLFVGEAPYTFLPGIDISKSLRYTPLIRNKDEPDEYFIGVESIAVNGEKLAVDPNLFKISNKGNKGGTRLSSVTRYTQLHPSIFKSLVDAFVNASAARGIPRVGSVAPFEACFDATKAFGSRVGYNVPEIDLKLEGSGGVVWGFVGANCVVSVSERVLCLAFQKSGQYEPRSIVVGTFQQENAFLEFNLATSRLGILPTLLGFRTTCANFNFTSSP